jgi:hypothetical protein
MASNRIVKSPAFWSATLIVLIAILVITGTWLKWFRLSGELGGESLHHWFSYGGAGFIAIYLPIYSILKRRYPNKLKTLIRIHVFGNLLSSAAISIHFSHHLTRPPQTFPDLGTGIALIAALIILVITGFVLRFRLARKGWTSWRWVHTGTVLSFYLIIVLHILHGLGVI